MTEVNNEYDEIIFDYLEGNLSENERSAFEILLSTDQQLSAQVKAWRNTYVLETFPITKDLETHILALVKRRTWMFSLNTFIYVLLVTLFTSMPSEEPVTTSGWSGNTVQTTNNTGAEKNCETKFTGPVRLKSIKARADVQITATGDVKEKTLPTHEDDIRLLRIPNTLPLHAPLSLEKIEMINRPVKILRTTKSSVKQLSKKELRQIRRKKLEDYKLKSQKEFLKGNVPYVVPLDINNF